MNLLNSIQQSHKSMVEGRDVPWMLRQWVERTPENPFMIWEPFEGEGATYSYREFDVAVRAVAAALHKKGVAFGEKVLLHMDNSPEFVISWFACAHI
ncbi:MAG: AMP-binding protein, partial [Proteobacteria bacterium]|nr:AMP-binding protein [Pseudomonadota bacterium]